MDILKQLDEAVNAAFTEFKKEFGQDVKLEDGDEFVTVFNNAALVISLEDNTLKNKIHWWQTVSGGYDTCNL